MAALAVSALALAGCSTSIVDLATPADAPAKPKEADGYLPVDDLAPDRDEAVIPPAERAKIEAELIKARSANAQNAATQTSEAK